MAARVTIATLQRMKPQGQKIVAVVAYDYQIAQIVDRAGVDLISVGDSVGVNLWGHASQLDVTLEQMVLVCQAVRRGVTRALVSCDIPFGPLQEGTEAVGRAAIRLVEDGGADLVKLDGAADHPDAIRAIVRAGVPVWAQFGVTPHTGVRKREMTTAAPDAADAITNRRVAEAVLLEEAGASLLDFTHSGPVAGSAVVRAVNIPVIGGLGGGPWLDGRVRSVFAAIGYSASTLNDTSTRYANVAETVFDAVQALCDDVRAGRQILGG